MVTDHRLHIPETLVDNLQRRDVDSTQLVREPLGFLLDRAPATSVPPDWKYPRPAVQNLSRIFDGTDCQQRRPSGSV